MRRSVLGSRCIEAATSSALGMRDRPPLPLLCPSDDSGPMENAIPPGSVKGSTLPAVWLAAPASMLPRRGCSPRCCCALLLALRKT